MHIFNKRKCLFLVKQLYLHTPIASVAVPMTIGMVDTLNKIRVVYL